MRRAGLGDVGRGLRLAQRIGHTQHDLSRAKAGQVVPAMLEIGPQRADLHDDWRLAGRQSRLSDFGALGHVGLVRNASRQACPGFDHHLHTGLGQLRDIGRHEGHAPFARKGLLQNGDLHRRAFRAGSGRRGSSATGIWSMVLTQRGVVRKGQPASMLINATYFPIRSKSKTLVPGLISTTRPEASGEAYLAGTPTPRMATPYLPGGISSRANWPPLMGAWKVFFSLSSALRNSSFPSASGTPSRVTRPLIFASSAFSAAASLPEAASTAAVPRARRASIELDMGKLQR